MKSIAGMQHTAVNADNAETLFADQNRAMVGDEEFLVFKGACWCVEGGLRGVYVYVCVYVF